MTEARLATPRSRALALDRRFVGVLVGRGLLYVAGVALVVIFCVPLFWTLSGSFKTIDQIYLLPPVWWPRVMAWQNYARVWQVSPYWLFYQNTIIVSLSSALAQITSASLVAYGFARFRFPGRAFLFMLVLSTLMLPPELTMVPQFLLFKQLSWLDTWLPLIVPNFFGGPFMTFLLRQFFLSIPLELDDAARIDGCSSFGIYWRIILPLAKPALMAVTVFTFNNTWNEFLAPLIYLSSKQNLTIALGLRMFQSEHGPEWHLVMAASLVTMLPILLVFFLGQRYFIQGIVFTGVKG